MNSAFTTEAVMSVHRLMLTASGGRRVTVMIHADGLTAMVWAHPNEGGLYHSTPILPCVDELYKAVEQIAADRWPSQDALAADLGLNPDGTFIQQAAE